MQSLGPLGAFHRGLGFLFCPSIFSASPRRRQMERREERETPGRGLDRASCGAQGPNFEHVAPPNHRKAGKCDAVEEDTQVDLGSSQSGSALPWNHPWRQGR